MSRTRPRKILGALSLSAALTILRVDKAVLVPVQAALRNLHKRLVFFHYGTEYEGSPDDIFIVTYPKSGTTWLQMIVYQLTSKGEIDFANIDQVSPHLEEHLIPRRRQISDLRATPRVVKSHLPYHKIPKGPGRYICGVRNGLDVAVSYHYHARKFGWSDAPSASAFFSRYMAGDVPFGSWIEHVAGWLRNKDRLNLLVVTYEELNADLEAGVRRIADFCGITIDPADMPRILERCSFHFMRKHDARFLVGKPSAPRPGSPELAFIRQGRVGGWREELDARCVSEFQAACDRRLRNVGEDLFRVLTGRGPRETEPVLPRHPLPAASPSGSGEGVSHTAS